MELTMELNAFGNFEGLSKTHSSHSFYKILGSYSVI